MYFAEQFAAPRVTFGLGRHDHVAVLGEQRSLLGQLAVVVLVEFEPVREVEWSQAHRETPAPRVEWHVVRRAHP